jgi:hypothetical protein
MIFHGEILHYRVYGLIEIEGIRITFCGMTDHSHIGNIITRPGMYECVGRENECVGHRNEWVGHGNEWIGHKKL